MIEITATQTHDKEDNVSQVMIQSGMFENRVVHTAKAHPQIGWINYEGKRQNVFIGSWGGSPTWNLAHGDHDPQYLYCAERTVTIENDPDYCGADDDKI